MVEIKNFQKQLTDFISVKNRLRQQYKLQLTDSCCANFCNDYAVATLPTQGKHSAIIFGNGDYIECKNFGVDYVTKNHLIDYMDTQKGLMDFDGNIIVPECYSYDSECITEHPYEDEHYFKICNDDTQKTLWGLMRDTGEILADCIYEKLFIIGNGNFVAEKDHKCGIIDISGHIEVPFIYDNIYNLSNKYFSAQVKGKWGLFTMENQTVIEPQYQALFFYENYGIAKKDGKWGIIDPKNNSLTGFIFSYQAINFNQAWRIALSEWDLYPDLLPRHIIKDPSKPLPELTVTLCQNGKFGVYSLLSGECILPVKYTKIYAQNHDLFVVKTAKTIELLNKNKEVLLVEKKTRCYDICYAHDEMIRLRYKDGINFRSLNDLSKDIFPVNLDEGYFFSENLAAVALQGNWGFINTRGEVVIPMIFDDAMNFSEGKAFVSIGKKGGFIHKNGEELILRKIKTLKLSRKGSINTLQ